MIKTNIKMKVTPGQSRRVQEICFENGIYWAGENKNKVRVYSNFLYIRGLVTHDSLNNFTYFKEAEEEEIDADFFIKTNGTCEKSIRDKEQSYYKSAIQYYDNVVEKIMEDETYLTKYTSQPKDLKSALKKIENLHIALNKKVEKNKNQALEINKLLEQKKDLQEINDTQNKYIKELEDMLEDERNHFMLKTSKHELKINELENLLKEKDTIISYLESKLK